MYNLHKAFPDMSRRNQIGDQGLFCCLWSTNVLKIEFSQQQIKRDNSLQEFGFELTSSEAVPRHFSVAMSDFLAKQ